MEIKICKTCDGIGTIREDVGTHNSKVDFEIINLIRKLESKQK